MTTTRPVTYIIHDLETAMAYRERCKGRPTDDPLAVRMREANDKEILQLQAELRQATSGELELTLTGTAYEEHRVGLPFLTRVLSSLQSAFRAVYRSGVPSRGLGRQEATLALVATSPGSFRFALTTPPAQLELLGSPPADKAISEIVGLMASAEGRP